MKICFPIQDNKGMDSEVYNHFGSAPLFIILDSETGSLDTINNGDRQHSKGACNPLKALDNRAVDAVIVGGIGQGALTRLSDRGIRVFRAQAVTLRENAALLRSGKLSQFSMMHACGGHGTKDGCAH